MTLKEILRQLRGAPLAEPGQAAAPETLVDLPVHSLAGEALSAERLAELNSRAESQDGDAQVELGMAHYRGLGVEADRAEAFKWFTLAADNAHAEGARLRKLVGPGLSDDEVHEARCRVARFRGEPAPVRWLLPEREAEGIVPDAAERPEVMITPQAVIEADVVPPEGNMRGWAWFWGAGAILLVIVVVVVSFLPARDQSGAMEQMKRADIREEEKTSTPSDDRMLAQGFEALLEMAKGGHVRAQYLVGLSYMKGDLVEASQDLAAFWYQQAAYAGDRDAQNNFGVLYVKGEVVAQDVIEAYKWFALAAERGSIGAAKNRDQLAFMLGADQIAEGTKRMVLFNSRRNMADKSVDERNQLKAAALAGNAEAQYQMGLQFVDGGVSGNNFAEAMKWFGYAATQGHPNAQNNLGVLISLGMGGSTNLMEAYKWIVIAESRGCADATKNKEEIGAKLTAAELAEALKRVAQFRPEPVKPEP